MKKAFAPFKADSALAASVVPAAWGNVGRAAAIDLAVIHSTEGSEGYQAAENIAGYFASGSGGRPSSTHYVVDPNSVVQCVPERSTAFGAAKANARGIHVELCGLAGQTAAQWADAASASEIKLAARLFADICRRNKIPVRFLTAADLKAGKRGGITTHAEVSKAWPSTGHTDPGVGFPLQHFLDLVKAA